MVDYDVCIIGGGIAGLYCARELSKAWPDSRICILEKYPKVGGRASTFETTLPGLGKIQWEEGAGRIHKSHKQVFDLLKGYDLEVDPIPPGIEWRTTEAVEPIEFSRYIQALGLSQISKGNLQRTTLQQILRDVLGSQKTVELTDRYEYRSEIDTLRADKGLEALEHELGIQEGFFVVRKGFSALVKALESHVKKLGVKILTRKTVSDVHKNENHYTVLVKDSISLKASKVVLAVSRNDLVNFPSFKHLAILKQVKMRPLVRMYAVFPMINGSIWFEGIHKFLCQSPIRFVIPMNPKKGTIMISYTDGKDAEYWMKKLKLGKMKVQNEVMQEIRKLFPALNIPEPILFKIYPWADGCSYWTPGDYDFNAVSKASVRPLSKEMPGVYMCNESWAYNQSWVVCSIDQARHAFNAMVEDSQ
jgi:glycine/D-amino acid oxidase-like deaminating enzyme